MTARHRPTQLAMLNRGPRIGIDPGATGKIALVTDAEVLAVRSMPRLEDGGLDGERFLSVLDALDADRALPVYCERIAVLYTARRGEEQTDRDRLGGTLFAFYKHVGALECCLAMCGRHVQTIAPNSWKAKAKLLRAPKDASREIAVAVYGPSAWPHCRRDTNAADAVLIGYLGPQFDTRTLDNPIVHTHTEDPF